MALTVKEDTFDFYLRFAKPLVLNLTEPDDRVLAAAWIQKLRDESVGDTRLRTDYLKLLLFVLQRDKLIGPFAENPNIHQQLNEFPQYKLNDVAKELLESEEQFHKKRTEEGIGGENPPYTTEYSADLLEYAAAQIIPNFGIHAYYAISNEPLSSWKRTEKAVFPRGPSSATEIGHTQSPQVNESLSQPSMASKHVKFKFQQRTIFNSPGYSGPVPPKSPKMSTSPPFTSPPKGEGEGERTPPTWGSNLIGVTEPPVLDRTPPSPLFKELMDELGMSVRSSSEDTSPSRNAAVRFTPKHGAQGTSPLILPEGFEDILDEQEPSFVEDFYSPPPLSPSKYPKSYREMISEEFDRLIDDRQSPHSKLPKTPQRSPKPYTSSSPARTPYCSPILPEGHRDLFLEDEPSFIGGPFSPPPLSPGETWGIAHTSGAYVDDSILEEEPCPASPRPQTRTGTPSPIKSPCPANPCSPRPMTRTPSPARTPKPYASPIRPEDVVGSAFPSPSSSPGFASTSGAYIDEDVVEGEPGPAPSSPRQPIRTGTPSPTKSPCGVGPCSPRPMSRTGTPSPARPPRTPSPARPPSPARIQRPYVSPIFPEGGADLFLEDEPSFIGGFSPPALSPGETWGIAPCSPGIQPRTGTPSPTTRSPKPYYTQILDEEGDDLILEDTPSFMENAFSPPPLSPGEAWGVVRGTPPDEFDAFDQMLDEFEKEEPKSIRRPPPKRTGIPLPRGTSRIPSASRIPRAGGSATGIPSRTGPSQGSRIPQPGQKSRSRTSRLPTKRTAPTKEVDILFVDDPSLPLRTPSPKRPDNVIEEIPLVSSPYPASPVRQLQQPPDLLETLGLSSNDLGDLEQENEPVIQEPTVAYTSPVEEVFEESEEPQELELARPPLLSGSSPAAQDIIETFNRENTVIEAFPGEEAAMLPTLSEGVYLDDIDFPEADEYEEMHVSERSPGATRADVSRQLRDIQADYYQMKSTSPADAGVPITTPRKSPIPKRPLRLYFEDEDRGFTFTVPEYQSPDRLQFETPPYYTTSPGSPASPSEFPDEYGLPKPFTFAKLQRMKRRTPSPSPPQVSRTPRTPSPSPQRYNETDVLTAAIPQFEFPRSPPREYQQEFQAEVPQQATRSPRSPLPSTRPESTAMSESPLRTPPPFVPPEWSISHLLTEDTDIFEEPFDFPSSPEPIPEKGYQLPVCEGEDDIFSEEAPLDLFDELLSPDSPKTPPQKRRIPKMSVRSPKRLDAVTTRLFEKEDERIESPISSPESPITLKARLYRRPDEPYERSKATRASRRPRVRAIREVSEAYDDIDIPFLQRVEDSRSKIRRRRRKIDMNVCHLGNVAESPIEVPYMGEVEGYLPDLPYPEDLMGSSRYDAADQIRRTPLDITPPKNLPPPMSPQSRVLPGWRTPPHLRTAPPKRPPPLLPGLAENIRLPAEKRDILQLEGDPSEMAYSPPPISPEEAIQMKSQFPQPLRHSPPRTPVRVREELILDEEQEPEEMMYASPVASPKTPSPPRPRPQTPESPPESPLAFRLRVHRSEAPPYYSRASMPVVVGNRKVSVKRHSQKPRVHSVREIPDDYPEDEVVFLSKVESSKKNFTKRMKKIKISRPALDEIGESPVKVPNMFEAEDPTGVRYVVEEIERKHADLPDIDVQYPDDLMGSTIPTAQMRREYTTMDWTPPRDLPSPIRPTANVPSWDSPVRMKTNSGLLPGRAENVRLPKYKRDILEEEILPDLQLSPPQLTDLERAEMRAAYTPKPPPIVAREESHQPRTHQAPIEMLDLIDDETLDEDLQLDDMLAESPPRPRSPQREPPESPPEDPLDLHLRLYLANIPASLQEPLEYTDVVVGGRQRRIQRRSAAPRVNTLREISEDYPDEITPFLSRVESAGKLPNKRRRRIRKTNLEKKMENVILMEEPLHVPTMFEADDPTGFRKMREELESRFKDLPELPDEGYPDDLLGQAKGGTWETSRSILDMEEPRNLPSPLQPQGRLYGWKTPPHLAKPEAKSQSPFRVKLKPELRDVLLEERPPEEMFSLPPSPPQTQSYTSPPRRLRQSPVKRASPLGKPSPVLSPVLSYTPPRTFEQISSAPDLLDDEMLIEDDYEPDSPFGATSLPPHPQTQRRQAPPRWQKPTAGGKLLAREAARDARKLLMEEEEGVIPSTSEGPQKEPAKIQTKKSGSRLPMKKGTRATPRPARPAVGARKVPSGTRPKRDTRKIPVKEDVIPVPTVTSITKVEKSKEKVTKETVLEQRNAWLDRIEELIKDVGDPHIPRPRPRDIPRFSLPEWSELPSAAEWDDIDSEIEPEDVWMYRSPKTPSPEKSRSPSPHKMRTPSPRQRTPVRNIFESNEGEEFLDDAMLEDLDLQDGPMTPPTPPRLEDFYEVYSPQSPDEFEGFTQSLREHRYTPQHYDVPKRMMMARVLQVKNKRVPLRQSKRPGVRTVYETRDEQVVQPEPKPRYEVKQHSLNFESPPKLAPVPMPEKYAYDPYSERIGYTSPPRFYSSPEPLEKKPNVQRPKTPPNYELPRPVYYGSPGREFVRSPFAQRRSPRRALPETDSDMGYDLPVEEHELPNFDEESILLEADELNDDDVAGFQWMG
ncbi:titin-like [Photinus pyralis]|uniref:titin-like n=1 Tax=Photinus pyralis TaxID=7054 RepID=UPI00126764B9|nr:titin-like [Photinus pyralis]